MRIGLKEKKVQNPKGVFLQTEAAMYLGFKRAYMTNLMTSGKCLPDGMTYYGKPLWSKRVLEKFKKEHKYKDWTKKPVAKPKKKRDTKKRSRACKGI